jgi:cytochrome c553
MRITHLIVAGVVAACLAPVAQADVHIRGIAATCMSCHGPHGKSGGAIPSIAGLDKAYFAQAMKEFKSGTRASSVMKKHAAGYTDAEFDKMGEFFAAIK